MTRGHSRQVTPLFLPVGPCADCLARRNLAERSNPQAHALVIDPVLAAKDGEAAEVRILIVRFQEEAAAVDPAGTSK